MAGTIRANGWPMVMNVVLHRMNIEHVDRIIGMAAADPVCPKSPQHHPVQAAIDRAQRNAAAPQVLQVVEHPLVLGDPAASRRLSPNRLL